MDILIVTDGFESLKNFIGKLILVENLGANYARFKYDDRQLDILITGAGGSMATYELTKAITSEKYNLVLQVGRCFSLKDQVGVENFVCIIDDYFGDMGFGTGSEFESLFDQKIRKKNELPFKDEILENHFILPDLFQKFRKVSGITCNNIPSKLHDISNSYLKNYPDVISMEAANVLYVCLKEKVKLIQWYYVVDRIENSLSNHSTNEKMSDGITENLELFLSELKLQVY